MGSLRHPRPQVYIPGGLLEERRKRPLPGARRNSLRSARSRVVELEAELAQSYNHLHELNEELQDRLQTMEKLARTDSLTGLYNRRYWRERLLHEVARSRRYGVPLSLVLVDLDHFKSINDRFGHLVGDEVLIRTSAILKEGTRTTDIAARYGGEEFCLLLIDTDSQGAQTLCERLRETLAKTPFRDPRGTKFNISASFGIAEYHPKITPEVLVQAADEALYAAKAAGRNRTQLAHLSSAA